VKIRQKITKGLMQKPPYTPARAKLWRTLEWDPECAKAGPAVQGFIFSHEVYHLQWWHPQLLLLCWLLPFLRPLAIRVMETKADAYALRRCGPQLFIRGVKAVHQDQKTRMGAFLYGRTWRERIRRQGLATDEKNRIVFCA
jgi:hypothetical protein